MDKKSKGSAADVFFPSEKALLDDLDIAKLVRMSRGWVRKQRHLRRKGLNHEFKVDPVQIGRCPRYLAKDVQAWLTCLVPTREA